MVQNTLEECDTTEEDAVLFVLKEDGTIAKRVGLLTHPQILLYIKTHAHAAMINL